MAKLCNVAHQLKLKNNSVTNSDRDKQAIEASHIAERGLLEVRAQEILLSLQSKMSSAGETPLDANQLLKMNSDDLISEMLQLFENICLDELNRSIVLMEHAEKIQYCSVILALLSETMKTAAEETNNDSSEDSSDLETTIASYLIHFWSLIVISDWNFILESVSDEIQGVPTEILEEKITGRHQMFPGSLIFKINQLNMVEVIHNTINKNVLLNTQDKDCIMKKKSKQKGVIPFIIHKVCEKIGFTN